MSATSTIWFSWLTVKRMRHDRTRRRYAPWYSPCKGAVSPLNGSPFISLSARLTRSRSRTGIRRRARSARLLSWKSQGMLHVVEAVRLAFGEFALSLADGFQIAWRERLGWGQYDPAA